MRNVLLAIFLACFAYNTFSQNDTNSKLYLLNRAISELNYPNINLSLDTIKYNKNDRLIEQWNKSYSEYAENMGIYTYKDYLKVKEKEYPQKPEYINTDNPKQDELNYKNKLNYWTENHPKYPKYIDTGNPVYDKEQLRKARLKFYNTYVVNKD